MSRLAAFYVSNQCAYIARGKVCKQPSRAPLRNSTRARVLPPNPRVQRRQRGRGEGFRLKSSSTGNSLVI